MESGIRALFYLQFILILSACQSVHELKKTGDGNSNFDMGFECHDEDFDWHRTRTSEDHIVRMNRHGLIVSQDIAEKSFLSRARAKPLSEERVYAMYKRIFCEAERLAESRAKGEGNGPAKVPLLVYVHGGLNSLSSTDRRVLHDNIPEKIMTDRADWHYPVFISWPSAALPTYGEQSFLLREGRRTSPWIGVVSSPFIVIADILRSIGNYPATFYYQVTTEKDRAASAYHAGSLSNSWKAAIKEFCEDKLPSNRTTQAPEGCETGSLSDPDLSVKANLSGYYVNGFERVSRGTGQTLSFPVRYSVGSLWHSGFSDSAWENMKRRTNNVFYPTSLFDERISKGVSGGDFFEKLIDRARQVRERKNAMEYEVTLVGHSMGSIVINLTLERHGENWIESSVLKNIVYMAAAASIDDTLSAVSPVIKNQESPVQFFNLTLNRVAEISETHLFGAVPLGSLLVSIDQHYERPEHPLKRTIGSEVNVLSAIDIIDSRFKGAVREPVFKAFDRCPGKYPAEHGDFGYLAYWREETWQIDKSDCESRYMLQPNSRQE
jgi:pimeloyl-ACP methyl ester carboxylesterase